ncbi:MAG: DUF484 family protein [Gammaproteobacteria bacterium]|nr:DUF484 family protein [Gammaproteobacteria bacterium]
MTKAIKKSQAKVSTNIPSPERVVAFLKANPHFFEDQDDLLLHLDIPHQRGASVSLVERQVTLLREKNIEMRRRLNDLVATAKINDVTFKRTTDLVLALLDATTAEQFLLCLENSLKNDFKCSSYRLIVFGDQHKEINHWVSIIPQDTVRENIPGLVENNRPVLGVLRPEEQDYIFGIESKKVKSIAILPIKSVNDDALLAIGNKDPEYFQARMGTLFLNFIADVLSHLIPLHLH